MLASPGEAAGVVVTHKIRTVGCESIEICRGHYEVAAGVVQKTGRDGDLEFRTVVGHPQDRLHDGIELGEVPVTRCPRIFLHRHCLRKPLEADVLWTQCVELPGFRSG